ncbi:hypothetical protein BMF90_01190 [Serratia sp. OLHL2]|jgi:hypothetical protein|uniref:Bacteriocin n=3 Tax=Serratia TaxID=613 RepID=A0A9X9C0X5_9GAMM|nr:MULTISPECIES: hypothetical protein [Enterobacterales]KAB5499064.1 hypothetical protein F8564_05785 [Enterobacter sp. RJAL6]KLE39538.1 hypothetical protein ABA78_06960 [Serratia sp. TEL]WIF07960.1 hypothetical protein QEP77_06905 [Serratia sp. B1]SVK46259.1 Uncharacterised protein [Acinetobacter baumannii]AGE18930.1 hypothetical protein SMWW4_v1c31360 [Serratia marcescens WW4]
MKELTEAEVMAVSGAGIASDAGKILGNGIGAIVDAGTGLFGIHADAAGAGAKLGEGIGAVIDAGISAFSQLFGRKSS